ncbi:peptidoglycan-binding protein [Microvirga sp. RSM25]|uniref:peptidoglycan-binding domain-containing protein n=1 Tax=Microvirga sp. RSM25 TaxID=3273802 RepID=UPI00384BA5C8
MARLSQAAETASADREALAAELERFIEGNQDLRHIQKQIAAAAQELKHLQYLRGRVSGEIDTTRPQPSRAPSQASPPGETSDPLTVGSIPLSKEDISNAQQALTRLGYGPLKADGIVGPGTRRSIEAFQRAKGLPVTGQLEADTLRTIKDSQTTAQP